MSTSSEHKFGVLYIVTGDNYLNAAIKSARSVRKYAPELGIHLFTGDVNYPRLLENKSIFDSIEKIEKPHRRSKVEYLNKSPFERTLYLDSDTEVVAPIFDLFEVLDAFDLALCHAHVRNHPRTLMTWKQEFPRSFPQFNGGVILYKCNPKTTDFFEQWATAFEQAGFAQDQVTLRETLWNSDLRMYTLPPEYNVRFWKYLYLWNAKEVMPRILHMQKYHDGPFWFLKNWAKAVGRPIARMFGFLPSQKRKKENR